MKEPGLSPSSVNPPEPSTSASPEPAPDRMGLLVPILFYGPVIGAVYAFAMWGFVKVAFFGHYR